MPSVQIQTSQGTKTINFTGTPPTPEDIDQISQQNGWSPASAAPTAGASGATTGAPPAPSQPGYISRVATGLAQGSVGQEITGIAKGVGQTLTGIASVPQNIANAIVPPKGGQSALGPTISQQTSSALAPKGGWQQTGNVLEKGAELLAPTDEISAAKDVMEGADLAKTVAKIPGIGEGLVKGADFVKGIPYVGKALSYGAQKVLSALPEAGFGTAYGLSQGQTPGEAVKTGGVFGVLSGLGEVVGDTWRAVKGGVVDNIQKAVPTLNKLTPDQAVKKVPQALDAFKTMANLADDIKVKTVDGLEKQWEPTKDGFYEDLQAFQQSKQKVYDAYTELAKKAGDTGAVFSPENFATVEDDLSKTMKDTTSGFVGKAKSLIGDLQRNFGTFDEDGQFMGYKSTDLSRIQKFIQDVNIDVNPGSDRAGAQVSDTASKSLRGVMDKKIENALPPPGAESVADKGRYQKLRDSYSNLKSIEDGLVSSTKKAFNKVGGRVGQWIEGFGAIDTIVGALTNAPVEAAKGGLLVGFSELMRYLKDPEVGLQNAFDQIINKDTGSLSNRVFGKGGPPAQTGKILKSLAKPIAAVAATAGTGYEAAKIYQGKQSTPTD